MYGLFSGCSSLISLPDISWWDTGKVIHMNHIFNKCSSLVSINCKYVQINKIILSGDDIYDILLLLSDNNIILKQMKNNNMFIKSGNTFTVEKLSKLIESDSEIKKLIEKLDKTNSDEIKNIHLNNTEIKIFPNISNWNTSNVKNMSGMFSGCKSLTVLPDISEWNTENVIYMDGIFSECESLKSLPDISKWNTINADNISCMFYKCSALITLPDISKWNVNNVNYMNSMLYKCLSLISLPDISKWNTSNIKDMIDMIGMFDGCKKSLKIPIKFKK